jgi:D-beta-D-heptose 7-phosphate kinase/D-beta-D-heptose 1-phosphate adenosyltransferase
MVTRGDKGLSLMAQDGTAEHIPARGREVYDVTGAGDTVVSVFGMAVFAGLPFGEAAAAANVAGGIVVGKLGASTVKRGELLHHLQNRELTAGSKVVSLDLIAEELGRERCAGKKVVFTNGCFDPLHKGHVSLLEEAAKLGDILIVGLNSDSSVRRLKGENRPSVAQEDRAYILGALGAVDYVVIFDEDTPENLIREIRPNYLVKGNDYRPEEVVGREFVEGYGGEVKLIPLVPDKSSTGYIMSVVEKHR